MCELNFRSVFFNISKEIAKEKSDMKNWEIEEADIDKCSGWKSPDECPNDGKFNPDHPACQECEKDAGDAIYNDMRDPEIFKGGD